MFEWILTGIFCPYHRRKIVEFFAWSDDLLDVENVGLLMGSSEYAIKVIGLVSFYCIVMHGS